MLLLMPRNFSSVALILLIEEEAEALLKTIATAKPLLQFYRTRKFFYITVCGVRSF